MKRILSFVLIVAVLTVSNVSTASVKSLKSQIDQVITKAGKEVGILAISLDKQDLLYSKNSKKVYNPASATKVITTGAVLESLGPKFNFHTKFYMSPVRGKGYNLYVRGEGDPSIVIEELIRISNELYKTGLKNIKNIVIDNSFFRKERMRVDPQLQKYNPYTDAVSLNFNRMKIIAKPGKTVGSKAKVVVEVGEDIYIELDNEVVTTNKRRSRIDLLENVGSSGSFLSVVGEVPLKSRGVTVQRHVPNPALYFGYVLKSLLLERGMKISGVVRLGKTPSNSKLVVDYLSKPMCEIVADMNKFSNNMIAEQLFKSMGGRVLGEPAEIGKGLVVVKKYMSSLGVGNNEYVIMNGSGLSYKNRISAYHLVLAINDMYKDRKLSECFIDSLSIAGVDGTMRRRHKSPLLKGKMKAKTGTLEGVSTVAGVLPSASGEMIAFAILINGNSVHQSHKIQDEIAKALASFRR